MLLVGFDHGLAINQQFAIGQALDEHDPVGVLPIFAVHDFNGMLGRIAAHDRPALECLAFEPRGIAAAGRLAGCDVR